MSLSLWTTLFTCSVWEQPREVGAYLRPVSTLLAHYS